MTVTLLCLNISPLFTIRGFCRSPVTTLFHHHYALDSLKNCHVNVGHCSYNIPVYPMTVTATIGASFSLPSSEQ